MSDSKGRFYTNSRDCWDRKSEKYLESKRPFSFEISAFMGPSRTKRGGGGLTFLGMFNNFLFYTSFR